MSLFDGVPFLALTCLFWIDACTMCRNNRPPLQLLVCLTHMNARTPTHTYAGIRTNRPRQTNVKTTTHTQSVFHSLPPRSSSFLYIYHAQMCQGTVFSFSHLLHQGQVSNFIIFYLLTFFPLGVSNRKIK